MFQKILPFALLLTTPLIAVAQTPSPTPAPATEVPKPPTPGNQHADAPPTPEEFAQRAAASNVFEVKTAELALSRSGDEFVRSFARQLITDHRKAQMELEAAAAAQEIPIQASLDSAQRQKVEALTAAPDADFDSAFLSAHIVAHQSAMELFALYEDQGTAGPLKAHARAQYPGLHNHFMKAQTGSTQ